MCQPFDLKETTMMQHKLSICSVSSSSAHQTQLESFTQIHSAKSLTLILTTVDGMCGGD